jgi:putative membrane protein
VSRGTQNTVLLLIGMSIVVMVAKGSYLYYVKPALLPWLVAAAVVLIGLAVVSVIRDVRGGGDDSDHVGHRHRSWLLWFMVVPIALMVFVVPPPLGAQGATPDTAAANEPMRRPFPPLPAGSAPMVSIPDLVMRAAADSTDSLHGRLITITGFTLKYPGSTDLGRVVIVCCAADAQLARIHLSGPALAQVAGIPENTWLEMEGTIVAGTSTAATNYIPTLTVTSFKHVDKPANTYAY